MEKPSDVPKPPGAIAAADKRQISVGCRAYSMNPWFRDGTRLRNTPTQEGEFNGVWLPNDEPVNVLKFDESMGALDRLDPAEQPGIWVHVEKPHTGEQGWIKARNLQERARRVGYKSELRNAVLAEFACVDSTTMSSLGGQSKNSAESGDHRSSADLKVSDSKFLEAMQREASGSEESTERQGSSNAVSIKARYVWERDDPNHVLGSGSFGCVFRAFDNHDGNVVAIKVSTCTERGVAVALAREFRMLRRLEHANIVRVKDFAVDSEREEALVIMEYMPGGSLVGVLRHTQYRLHERVVRRYAADALRGLAYLHKHGVVHRDVKPGNMLLGADGVVRLSDFGTVEIHSRQAVTAGRSSCAPASVQTGGGCASLVGTILYLAPECIESGAYTPASDMWAWACTVVELASGMRPWYHLPPEKQSEIPLIFHICTAQHPNHSPKIPAHISDDLRMILRTCFSKDPANRPAAQDLLDDGYFAHLSADTPLPSSAEPLETFAAAVTASLEERTASPAATSEGMSRLESDTITGSVISDWPTLGSTVGSTEPKL